MEPVGTSKFFLGQAALHSELDVAGTDAAMLVISSPDSPMPQFLVIR